MKQFKSWIWIQIALCFLSTCFVFFFFDQKITVSFFIGALLSTSNVIFYFFLSYFLLKSFLHRGVFLYLFLGYLLKYGILFLIFWPFFSEVDILWVIAGFSTFIVSSLIERIKIRAS